MTAFATSDDLLLRYDYRVIGQLLSDTGVAADAAGIAGSDVTAALLADASGSIVSYALKGGRYTEADLLAMTGNGLALLVRLTCDYAFYLFTLRRGLPVDRYPQVDEALVMLESLSQGNTIFPIQANIDAGHAQSPPITVETIVQNSFLTDVANQGPVGYFPTRRLTQQQIG